MWTHGLTRTLKFLCAFNSGHSGTPDPLCVWNSQGRHPTSMILLLGAALPLLPGYSPYFYFWQACAPVHHFLCLITNNLLN